MTARKHATAPLKVFVSYSHQDEDYKNGLVGHLTPLEKTLGRISIWQDRAIDAGDEWNQAILEAIDAADIILMLITARFLQSGFCMGKEMTRALMHHEQGQAHVIPIIIAPCAWQQMPFAKLQVLPKDGQPITEWKSLDAGYDNATQGIIRLIDKLLGPIQQADDGWSTPTHAAAQASGWSTTPAAVAAPTDSSAPPPPEKTPKSLTQQRLALFNLLSALPGPTFDAIVYALNVPVPLIPPPIAPQGQRVPALLNWAQSPVGCGLEELEAVVNEVVQR